MYTINSLTWQLKGSLGQEFGDWLREDGRIERSSVRSTVFYSPVGWDGAGMKHGANIGMMMATNVQVRNS